MSRVSGLAKPVCPKQRDYDQASCEEPREVLIGYSTTRYDSNGLSKITQCEFRLAQYLIGFCAQPEICYPRQRYLRGLKLYCDLRIRKCARPIALFCVRVRSRTVRTQIIWH